MRRHHISILICVLIVFSCLGVDVAWSQAKKDLNQAAVDGDLDRVKSLVSGGADVNVKNRMGMTPLVVAAMNSRTAVCEFLVANGADLNAKDGRSQTALYFAVDRNNKELVELLVKKGADVNITTGRGENAFSLAKKKRNADGNTEIVDLLAKNGATDPVISDVYGDEYYGGEGIRPGGPGGRSRAGVTRSVAQAAVQVDLLADPNEITSRIKTFDGLEKAIVALATKSSTETRHWGQSRYDNRTSLARAVQKQVEDELAFVRTIALKEKAKKTTEAIDTLVKRKQDRYKKVNKELLQQKREASQTQSSQAGARGGRRTSGRSSRGGRYSSGLQASEGAYDDGGAYGPGTGETGRYGRTARPARPAEQLDRETQDEIRLWLQATMDNKPDLAKSIHPIIHAEIAMIRQAVGEEAKKTTAAIDGILLARQVRFDVYTKLAETLRRAAVPGQDPRTAGAAVGGRRGRTTRGAGGTQQQNTQRGRTRRR
ncbi:MAG: ankyrin repeat domain-containing protein [Planctomycetota bacterium]